MDTRGTNSGNCSSPLNLEKCALEMVKSIEIEFPEQPDWRFVTGMAEEVGEFVGSYNRYTNTSRRVGNFDELQLELADVVFTAYMAACVLGIDLESALIRKWNIIMTRGWRDERG